VAAAMALQALAAALGELTKAEAAGVLVLPHQAELADQAY